MKCVTKAILLSIIILIMSQFYCIFIMSNIYIIIIYISAFKLQISCLIKSLHIVFLWCQTSWNIPRSALRTIFTPKTRTILFATEISLSLISKRVEIWPQNESRASSDPGNHGQDQLNEQYTEPRGPLQGRVALLFKSTRGGGILSTF